PAPRAVAPPLASDSIEVPPPPKPVIHHRRRAVRPVALAPAQAFKPTISDPSVIAAAPDAMPSEPPPAPVSHNVAAPAATAVPEPVPQDPVETPVVQPGEPAAKRPGRSKRIVHGIGHFFHIGK
ncbi:MAG: hypothetical protein ACRD30_03180, partial [Bryobacteraceae bacterium]